jgi:protein O-mannosyl-transferase
VSQQTASKFRALSHSLFICLLLALATLAVYWRALSCDFVNYDDPIYFTSNSHVLSGLNATNVVWAFTTGHAANWHPLTWLSLMLDAQIAGKNPFLPHLTNVLFHAADTVLLFLLLRRLTAACWRSALVAALFALHPLHVESVVWISERKDVLSAFFGLLALLSYAKFAKENRRRDLWLSGIFLALGLMAKPMLVTLPFVMLLLDYWPLKRISKFQISKFAPLLVEKIPFFVLAAVSGVITFIVQKIGGAVDTLTSYPMPVRVENAFVSCARYLGKTFWPANLAAPYPFPTHWNVGLVIFSVALLLVLSIAALRLARKFPFLPVGWFWFIGMLVPVIGIVQVGSAAMADRYTYLPLIGIFIALAWGLGELCQRLPNSKPFVLFAIALLLPAAAVRTIIQLGYWQNTEIFFHRALAVTKNNSTASGTLASYLSNHGRVQESLPYFTQALKINPNNSDLWYDAGNAYAKLGDWDDAILHYRRALQLNPNQADVLDNFGFALAAKGRLPEAVTNFEAALKLKPDLAGAHNNLATVLFRENRFADAAQHYRDAIQLVPDNPQIRVNLGDTLLRLGQTNAAVKSYQEALRLKPGDARIAAKLRALGVQPSK